MKFSTSDHLFLVKAIVLAFYISSSFCGDIYIYLPKHHEDQDNRSTAAACITDPPTDALGSRSAHGFWMTVWDDLGAEFYGLTIVIQHEDMFIYIYNYS